MFGSPIETAMRDALADVYDPCSMAARMPVSVVDMGLVSSIDLDEDGVAIVTLRTTSPGCTLVGSILEAIESKLRSLPGIQGVEVQLDLGGIWSEADMTDEGRAVLRAGRELRQRELLES